LLKYNGDELWVEDHLQAVFDGKGKMKYLEGVVRDITDRRKAEAALGAQKKYFESLFNSAPGAIVSLDMQRRVVRINKGFQDMFGYGLDEIRGKQLDEFLVPREKRREADYIIKQLEKGEKVLIDTIRRKKDGTLVDVEIHGRQAGWLLWYLSGYFRA
jgi:PAS domain S-box-containing protein